MASALDTARQSIQQGIYDAWAEATPLIFENGGLEPPDADAWVRVDILWGSGGPIAMDTRMVIGVIQATVFVRQGTGTGALTRYADSMRDILTDAVLGTVVTGTASGPRPGTVEQKWTSRIVDVSFEVQEAA